MNLLVITVINLTVCGIFSCPSHVTDTSIGVSLSVAKRTLSTHCPRSLLSQIFSYTLELFPFKSNQNVSSVIEISYIQIKITLYPYPELSTWSSGSYYLVDYFNEVLSAEVQNVIIPGRRVPVIAVKQGRLCAIYSQVQVVTTLTTFLWKFNKFPHHHIFNASGVIYSDKNIRDYINTYIFLCILLNSIQIRLKSNLV